jgi:calcineurin-like phosphoesterase family protein
MGSWEVGRVGQWWVKKDVPSYQIRQEKSMAEARIWVISDTHFGHENIYKFTSFDGVTRVRASFESALEADREMVQRWNSVVRPEDHVWHLGDVTMGSDLRIIKELLGHKRLLLGNHDRCDVRAYREAGFQKVQSYRFCDRWGIMSHIPLHPMSLGDKINIHGHIHEREAFGPQYKNVSVEQINYTPVLLEALKNG